MRKKLMGCDIILILLIWISILIVVLFVDFSSNKKEKDYNVAIYKTYYLYDEKSEPISLTYDMVELDKDAPFNTIITKIFEKLKLHLDSELELLSYERKGNELILKINKNIYEQKIILDSIINSYTNIIDLNKVTILYEDERRTYENNLEDYYVNSPLQNTLLTFLYKDSNYRLLYHNEANETITTTIKKISDERTVYLKTNDIETKWNVKNDGLYIDNKKVLTSTYKVGDTFENDNMIYKVYKVVIDEDDILNITVSIDSSTDHQVIVLKQGIGLYNYEKYDLDNNLLTKYNFYKRRIVKVS